MTATFPDGFLWGTATASHQVEGNNVNNHYWEWEHAEHSPFADKSGDVQCHIYPSERCPTHEEYGLLVADLVRHVARAFNVGEEDVWEWVDKERRHPTTAITNPS